MGLEEVKKEILKKANDRAKGILDEGRKEAERIAKETEDQIRDYMKKADDDTGKLIENMERKEKAGAEFEAKKMLLDRKKELVDKAFMQVKKKLEMMPESRREGYIKKLVDNAKKEIDVAVVYANSRDSRIVRKMPGIEFREAEMSGGIIAENKEGTIRVDYSYDELLDSIKKESMQEIASALFGK